MHGPLAMIRDMFSRGIVPSQLSCDANCNSRTLRTFYLTKQTSRSVGVACCGDVACWHFDVNLIVPYINGPGNASAASDTLQPTQAGFPQERRPVIVLVCTCPLTLLANYNF
jgi:hypothetical protein